MTSSRGGRWSAEDHRPVLIYAASESLEHLRAARRDGPCTWGREAVIVTGIVGRMSLADWKSVAEIVQDVVTSAAVVIGGVWAYFKLWKGRTFRPHVEILVGTRWLCLEDGGDTGLQVTVRLRNIGGAVIHLLQEGSGVMVSQLAADQPVAPDEAAWRDLGVYEVFTEHEWIEPSEVIIDDLLLWPGIPPQWVEVQVRIVLAWNPENITVHARRVFPPTSEALPTEAAAIPQEGGRSDVFVNTRKDH